jgi:Ca-activated chloride channel family protein
VTDLSFLEPSRLWLLIVPLVLLAGYVALQFRRRTYAVRFTNLALLDEVAPDRPGWRRHLPAAVLVLGVIAATLAFARPAVADELAEDNGIVILALDSSLSMEATDVSPSRVDAAKDAAKSFLTSVPDGVKIGVVGFDGEATALLAPTANMAAVERVIDRMDLGEGTAIGEAVFTALDAVKDALAHEDDKTTTTTAAADEKPAATIVLLSDGENTVGRTNEEAARAAAAQGVPVHTIAFGTDRGSVQAPTGEQVPVPVNREALRELASATDGQYFPAATGEQLKQVYEQLGQAVTTEPVTREVAEWFVGAAILFVVLAAAGSLLWFSRLP